MYEGMIFFNFIKKKYMANAPIQQIHNSQFSVVKIVERQIVLYSDGTKQLKWIVNSSIWCIWSLLLRFILATMHLCPMFCNRIISTNANSYVGIMTAHDLVFNLVLRLDKNT